VRLHLHGPSTESQVINGDCFLTVFLRSKLHLCYQIPFVWEASFPGARKEFEQASATFARCYRDWEKKHVDLYRTHRSLIGCRGFFILNSCIFVGSQVSSKQKKKTDLSNPLRRPKCMQHGDDLLFFNSLGAATKIYTQYEITRKDVRLAEQY
jgi:hypothetical protein